MGPTIASFVGPGQADLASSWSSSARLRTLVSHAERVQSPSRSRHEFSTLSRSAAETRVELSVSAQSGRAGDER